MPGPQQPSPRFDLAAVSQLESRDGGISKGGLTRNGFTEKGSSGAPWSWQRPALRSSAAAPLTGNGLGLYLVGDYLWGMYSTGGTATSGRILVQSTIGTGTTSFILDAVQYLGTSNISGYGTDGGGFGALTPDTWAGFKVISLYSGTGTSTNQVIQLQVQGTATQGAITSVRIGGTNYLTSTSVYLVAGGFTTWQWPHITPFPSATYPGTFVKP